mgnify:CR=1 FL=1
MRAQVYLEQEGQITAALSIIFAPAVAGRTLAYAPRGPVCDPYDTKTIAALLRETYGSKIKVFSTEIPHSVRAKEISAEGKSIFAHDPGGKVAESYKNLTQEVTKLEKQREKSRAGIGR